MTTQTTSRNTSGIILILVGLALFATQFMQGRSPEIFVFSVSAAFLAAYLLRRNIGLLIPGGILFGVGLSMLGGQWASAWGDFGGIGLGLGFISIYVISLLVERRSHWWPLL
ncbi:MAG: hypothetical protein KDE53_40250, partial [Caldilineaceae bacterium]|nr:hypothetical protein [Caldilineaceae bacterium]